MSLRRTMLAGLSLCAIALVPKAGAAPATDAGARELQTMFEQYIGKPAAGLPPAIAVTPAGESYRIVFDAKPLLSPLIPPGYTVAITPYEMTAEPAADGLWQVRSGNPGPISVSGDALTYSIVFEGVAFQGTFDPKIKSFILGETKMGSFKMSSRAKGFENDRVDTDTQMTITGAASGPGAVTAVVQQTTKTIRQVFRMGGVDANGSQTPGTEFSVVMGPIESTATIDSLRNDALLDLWSFFIANWDKEKRKGKGEQMLAKFRAAMPLFNAVSQTAAIKSLTVGTPMGPASASDLGFGMDLTGVVPDGRVAMKFSFDKLTLPPAVTGAMMPPWSKGLVPTMAAFDVKVSRFNLAVAANEILNNTKEGMPKAEIDALFKRAGMMIAPGGRVKVDIGPSRIKSDMLDVEFSGDIDVNIPIPKANVVVRVKGFDETVQALQPHIANDPKLQQAMLGAIAAKGFGKALPDGRIEWVIAVDPSGKATVNGFAVPIPMGKGKR
ncbi:MAG: hypothetical protein AB7F96_05870 [Beijerinckiaceae bacterium]